MAAPKEKRPRNYDGCSRLASRGALRALASDALARGRRSCRKLKNHRKAHQYPSTHYRERDGEDSTDAGNEKEISKDSVAVGTSRRRVEMEWDDVEGTVAKRFVSCRKRRLDTGTRDSDEADDSSHRRRLRKGGRGCRKKQSTLAVLYP